MGFGFNNFGKEQFRNQAFGLGDNFGFVANPIASTPTPAFSNKYSGSFDGTDDYITTNANYNSLNGIAKASFSIWMKPTNSGSALRYVFQRPNGGTGVVSQIGFWIFRGNRLEVNLNSTGVFLRGNISGLTLGAWNHIAITLDGTQEIIELKGQIYLNGVNVTTSNNLGSFDSFTNDPSTNDKLYIGENEDGKYNPFVGNLDEFAIWNTHLSSEQVSTIYNSGVPTNLASFSPAPINWWRFGDNNNGSGTTMNDDIGGATATLINGTSYVEDVPA